MGGLPIVDTRRRALLPPEGARFLRRRADEIVGLAWILLAAALLLAWVSYQPTDPSPLRAAPGPVRNLTGFAGAAVTDIGVQAFGLGWLLLIVTLGVWGWRLFGHRGLGQFHARLVAVALAVPASAVALGALPIETGFDLPTGAGGAFGRLLLRELLESGIAGAIGAGSLGIAAAGTAGLATLVAIGPTGADWRRAMVGCWRGLVALAPPERPQSAIADGSGRPAFRAPTVPFGPPSIPQLDDEVAASGLRAADGPPVLEPRTPDRLPPLDLLHGPQEPIPPVEAGDRGRLVAGVLADFGIAGTIGAPQAGPVVTRFAFDPAPGVRPGRVIGLADEIAHALGLRALRITTAADGGPRLIIEVPAADRLTIALAPLLKAAAFEHTAARLPIVVGADLGGGAVVDDLARHGALLIAGSPQAGVGTVLRSLLLSLVYRQPATRCRFLVVDPGGVRLAALADLPHRDQPMVTDPAAGVAAIAGLVDEVERRHRLIAKAGVRGLDAYNARVADLAGADARRLRTVQIGFDPVDNRPIYAEQPVDLAPLPILVAVVGEIAPLVASDRAAVVHALTRLAPIAAPVGVHVLVATRNPSAESLPSDLLAALPTRIVARLPGRLESRRLTGSTGAESLLGAGDCLWLEPGKPARRLHAPLVRDDELRAVARFVRERQASQPAIAA